jgi:cytidylate kinase
MAASENNTLVSADIVPVTSRRRTLSGIGFANIWIGMAIDISVFSFGASGIGGMGIVGVVTATFVANLVIAVIASLTGDIGVEHGLSFATYLRAPFGLTGVHLPAVARGVVASCWFGINTYIGALAINYFTLSLFGIDNWFLWFIVFAVVQVVNTMLGISAIDKFASLAAPCIIIITCWMFYRVNDLATLNNINILGYVPPQPSDSIWLITMCANMGMWAALACDIPNMTRSLKCPVGERNWLKRNVNNWIPQFLTLPIIESFIAAIGAISYLTTGNWNPVEVIQQQAEGSTLLILLVMVILAQKLDIPYYDEDMIKLASKELNVDESVVREENETATNDLVHALTAGGMFAAKEYEASKSDVMFEVQSQIVRDLARKSSCIIVGRYANYVLDQAHVPTIDIFVVANLEDRIKTVMARNHLSSDEAEAYINKMDKRRGAYINYYTAYAWGNPQYYDICVNTSHKNLNDLADHLASYINSIAPQTTAPAEVSEGMAPGGVPSPAGLA